MQNYIFFLWSSLQDAFLYITGFTCEVYFKSVYASIDATVLCLGKDSKDRALSAYKQEWHERRHSSLEVTISGLVIYPEYSLLGASLDGVVHEPRLYIQILIDNLKSSALIISGNTPLQAASQKGFCCWLEMGRLILIEHQYYYQVQGQRRSALESGAILWFLQMLGFLSSEYFLMTYSGLLWLLS